MDRRTRKNEHGFTLIEMLLAVALLGVLVVGVAHFFTDVEQARALMESRSQAQSQNELVFQRVSRIFRTRMQNAEAPGYKIEECSDPGQPASCLDVFRRRPVAGTDVIERYRIKNACVPLKAKEKRALTAAGAKPSVVGGAVSEMCNFRCAEGQRPVVVIRHWPDKNGGPRRDVVFPSGPRFGVSSLIGAGFCARQKSDSEALFLFGAAYLREDNAGFKALLAKKELVAPTKEDESKIEWLP